MMVPFTKPGTLSFLRRIHPPVSGLVNKLQDGGDYNADVEALKSVGDVMVATPVCYTQSVVLSESFLFLNNRHITVGYL